MTEAATRQVPMSATELFEKYKALHPEHMNDLSFVKAVKLNGEWFSLVHGE
jgi:hypothetical protein